MPHHTLIANFVGFVMTTKYKIILSFVGMMIIMAAMSMLDYLNIDEALKRIDEYRRLALISVDLNAALADFNEAGAHANMFLVSRDEKFMREALHAMDRLDKKLETSIKEMKNQKNLNDTIEIRKNGRAYKENLGKMTAAVMRMQEEFQTKVLSSRSAKEEEEMMNLMAETAHGVNNSHMLRLLQQMELEYATMRFVMGNVAHTRSGDRGTATLAGTHTNLDEVESAARAISEEINQALEKINRITREAADDMHQSSHALHEFLQTAQELRRVIEELK